MESNMVLFLTVYMGYIYLFINILIIRLCTCYIRNY